MAPIIGLICIALGISLAVVWWSAAFLAALKLFVVLCLIACGTIVSLVSYSSMKAAREFDVGLSQPPQPVGPDPENDVAPIV